MKRLRKLRAIRVILPFALVFVLGYSPLSAQEVPASGPWQRGDPHTMHWPQTPDQGFTGAAVSLSQIMLADDFQCTATGPVHYIHLWGSFLDDLVPENGPDSLTLELSLYSDVPASGAAWSRPGELLWTATFRPGQYTTCIVHDGPEDWCDPATQVYLPANHRQTYQYDFSVGDGCVTLEAGGIYWLAVKNRCPTGTCTFGWKTTARQFRWNDDAVYLPCACDDWIELTYPPTHDYGEQTLDLAFVVTSGSGPLPPYDLGDAPDSSNNVPGAAMTAYPGVIANFPTAYQTGRPPYGPLHHRPRDRFYLGKWVSLETQADIGADEDAMNNLSPQSDAANRDGGDDGLRLTVIMPSCQTATLDYTVTVAASSAQEAYVNVWCDWNRDGDWNDTVTCEVNDVPEWAVQNQRIVLSGIGSHSCTTPAFRCWHPAPNDIDPIWLRITIAEQPWKPPVDDGIGGAGPQGGYQYGETEDYYVRPLSKSAACTPRDWGDVWIPPLMQGFPAAATVEIGEGGAVVQGWIDFNNDGVWQTEEQVCDGFLPDGVHVIRFAVPTGAAAGQTLARFMMSMQGGQSPDTAACDCEVEVEDRQVHIDELPGALTAWCQRPDPTPHGIDIRTDDGISLSCKLADDFECTTPGRLTHIRLWGSWEDDCRGQIKKIHVAIHPDDPAGPDGTDRLNPYAKPGPETLWQADISPGQIEETPYYEMPIGGRWWDRPYDDAAPSPHTQIWQIDVNVAPDGAFVQDGSSSTYWLAVEIETGDGQFGWRTRQWPEHSGGDAVRRSGPDAQWAWQELYYPQGHPYYDLELNSIDMAFCLLFSPQDHPEQPTSQPPSITCCPAIETLCPSVETQCPVVATRCPPTVTQCPPMITECPIIETVCPTGETCCPASATECPIVATQCPISLTQCHGMQTFCPPVETMCPVNQTCCPAILTHCPPSSTQCPVGFTTCTMCTPLTLSLDSAGGAATLLVAPSCPVVAADCPTVGRYEAQTGAPE